MSNYPWCSLTQRDNISDIETRWLECQFWWRLSFTVNQFLDLKKNTAVLFWPQFPFFTILFLPRRWSVSVMSLIFLILIQGECESSRMAVFSKLTISNTLPWCRWQLGQHTRTHGILTSNALPAKLPSFSERESLEPGSSVMASRQSIWQSWRWSF